MAWYFKNISFASTTHDIMTKNNRFKTPVWDMSTNFWNLAEWRSYFMIWKQLNLCLLFLQNEDEHRYSRK